jgi:hypothetical protein
LVCGPPPSSAHEQALPSTLLTHAQSGFFPQAGSQLQAAPPCALSSQYQPSGHEPFPHVKHVPSSHAERARLSADSSLAASPSLSLSSLLARALPVDLFCAASCADSAAGVLSPPQPAPSANTKHATCAMQAIRAILEKRGCVEVTETFPIRKAPRREPAEVSRAAYPANAAQLQGSLA